jgi:heme-degrading monooxygenase HmoA
VNVKRQRLKAGQRDRLRKFEGGRMIARIWQARTRSGTGDAYDECLEQTGLKEYRATKGFRQVFVLRREIGEETDHVLLTLWDSMEAICRIAGSEPERAVYYPEDTATSRKKNCDPS